MRVGDRLVCINLAGEGRFVKFSNSARFFSRKQINTFAASITPTATVHAPPHPGPTCRTPGHRRRPRRRCCRADVTGMVDRPWSPHSPPLLSPGGPYPQPAANTGRGAAPRAHQGHFMVIFFLVWFTIPGLIPTCCCPDFGERIVEPHKKFLLRCLLNGFKPGLCDTASSTWRGF